MWFKENKMSYKVPLATANNWGIARAGTGITVNDGIINATGSIAPSDNYGFFYDTTTQTNPVPNTANFVNFNTTSTNNQVTVAGSLITVATAGTYSKSFSLSFEKTSAGAPTTASIWLRKNGVNVPNSNQSISVPNQISLLFVTGDYTLDLLAGENVQLAWSSPDTSIQLSFLAAGVVPTRPATPSAKITMIRIN